MIYIYKDFLFIIAHCTLHITHMVRVVSFDIGIVNLGVCVIDGDKVLVWKVIKLFEKMQKNIGINRVADAVYSAMDSLLAEMNMEHIDLVLLENQPSRINGTMKTIQMLLYGYFHNLKHREQKVTEIVQVNPSIKLKGVPMDRTCSKAEQYRNNKKKSIEICMTVIENCDKLKEIMEEYKSKKDDICDAMLQALSYLKEKKIQSISSLTYNSCVLTPVITF